MSPIVKKVHRLSWHEMTVIAKSLTDMHMPLYYIMTFPSDK